MGILLVTNFRNFLFNKFQVNTEEVVSRNLQLADLTRKCLFNPRPSRITSQTQPLTMKCARAGLVPVSASTNSEQIADALWALLPSLKEAETLSAESLYARLAQEQLIHAGQDMLDRVIELINMQR